MSCSGCSAKFAIFHKKLVCPNCGLYFCNSCLKSKTKVPDKGDTEKHVCYKCYSILENKTSLDSEERPPPDIYLKRLETLDNPAVKPITLYKTGTKIDKLESGLAEEDKVIFERLKKLKEGREKRIVPTDIQIRQRLANLKGETFDSEPKKHTFPPDLRSDQEKTDDLLKQYWQEKEIASACDPSKGIQERLEALQGGKSSEAAGAVENSDSEDDVEKITQKVMHEVAIDEKAGIKGEDAEMSEENDTEELPWCVLCNGDATVKCLDCNDLYCTKCNREIHKEWDEDDHKRVPFKPKNKQ